MRLEKPNRKVGVGALALGGSLGIVISWVLTTFAGVEVGEPVAAAFGSICSFIAGYFVPEA